MTEKDTDFLHLCREEITPLINKKGGASWEQMTGFLYHVRLLRYMTDDQVMRIGFEKVRGKRKQLANLGYLNHGSGTYRATEKTTRLLGALGYDITLLQPEPTGDGGVDSIRKTDIFIEALGLKNFKALLFPRFPKEEPYLIPDALLVEAESPTKYRLLFLEVETDKFYHDEYLENKKLNYERLGTDNQVYRYWCNVSEHLGLKKPSREQFCFSVCCLGNIKKEWNAWTFKTEL
jgi:hypothetical protein